MSEQGRRSILPAGAGHAPPAPRLSLTEQVYRRLKDDILEARCTPGQLLLEPELAARYGVSKTPVREALRLLVQEDWVTVMPRKGYLVRPVHLEDIREVFEIRHLLEPAMAATAATRRGPSDLDRLTALYAEQERSGPDPAEPLRAARAFHTRLAAVTGNRRAATILGGQLDEVRRLHRLMPEAERRLTSGVELTAHHGLLSAVRDGDPDKARRLMSEHLTQMAATMVDAFVGTRR
ncbi:GntR family transcriptional regulator [Streptomyces sp. NPDC093252]|uniref:GntR family transcriptional regulator n=1 Tax=Streptomyces sp. NPDC093252 TaxID=3154980 RepID=UPI00341C6C00